MDGFRVEAATMSECENGENDNAIQWETVITITVNPPLDKWRDSKESLT